MTLLEIARSLDRLDGEMTVYARKPWSESSPAIMEVEPIDGALPEAAIREGMQYFLEVFIAREVLEDWELSIPSKASIVQRCARLISYAENDA
ncbi:MAG: hypothetical protein RIC85_06260 [Gammaproteobacteria bacterium]